MGRPASAFVVASVTAVCVLSPGALRPAFASELPKQAREALEQNAAALSPLRLQWNEERSSHLEREELMKLTRQPDDKAFFKPQAVTVRFRGSAWSIVRKETQWNAKNGEFFTWYRDCRFDGSNLYSGNSMVLRPFITVEDLATLRAQNPNSHRFHAGYLTAAGFRIHNRNATIGKPPESEISHLIASGCEMTRIDGEPSDGDSALDVALATEEGKIQFVLDPELRYAVREIKRFNRNGELTQTVVNSDFFELSDPQFWLPARCVVSDFTWPTVKDEVFSEPLVITTMTVQTKNRIVDSAERFAIDLKPGTTVSDSRPEAARKPGARKAQDGTYSYQIMPADEELAKTAPVPKSRGIHVVIAVNFLIALGIVVLVAFKRRKR